MFSHQISTATTKTKVPVGLYRDKGNSDTDERFIFDEQNSTDHCGVTFHNLLTACLVHSLSW